MMGQLQLYKSIDVSVSAVFAAIYIYLFYRKVVTDDSAPA